MDWTALLTPEIIASIIALLLAIVGIPTAIIRLFIKRIEAKHADDKAKSDERILQLENDQIETRGNQTFNQKLLESFNSYVEKSHEMSQNFVDAINSGNEKMDTLIEVVKEQTDLGTLNTNKIVAEIQKSNQQAKQHRDIMEGKIDTVITTVGTNTHAVNRSKAVTERGEKKTDELLEHFKSLITTVTHMGQKLDTLNKSIVDNTDQLSKEHEQAAKNLEYIRGYLETHLKPHIVKIENGEHEPQEPAA